MTNLNTTGKKTARLFLVLALALILLSLASCATIDHGSHYDETVNFSNYKSFKWVSDDPYVTADSSIRISPLTQDKIRSAIRGELSRAGFQFVESNDDADMLIAFTVGTRDEIRVESYPIEYPGNWGWHVSGSYYTVREVHQHTYTKGALGIDIFDGTTNKPVWHGWAEKTITESDRKNPGLAISEGVARIFADFPQ